MDGPPQRRIGRVCRTSAADAFRLDVFKRLEPAAQLLELRGLQSSSSDAISVVSPAQVVQARFLSVAGLHAALLGNPDMPSRLGDLQVSAHLIELFPARQQLSIPRHDSVHEQ